MDLMGMGVPTGSVLGGWGGGGANFINLNFVWG